MARFSLITLCAVLMSMTTPVHADDGIAFGCTVNQSHTLFSNPITSNGQLCYYRIPAITCLKDGSLVAFCDLRINGTGDIGWGNAISIVTRKSYDNGLSWEKEQIAIAAEGEGYDFAHGDAAVVTDRETGRTLLLCASGTKGYAAGGCSLGRYYSEDGDHWKGGDISSIVQDAFQKAGIGVVRQFFTSGRILQSKKIKVGNHYRIYSALCTDCGSIVLCSDDFGESWEVLGNVVACRGGDETVLEELPNGNLLLSARLSGKGRGFNIFTYADSASGEGAWNTAASIGLDEATNCNGEMLLIPTADEHRFLLLHSVALSERKNVTIYYHVINTVTDNYNSPSFYADGWRVLQQMSTSTSCYSTMICDKEGNVAFLFEENSNGGYDIQYRNLSISQ